MNAHSQPTPSRCYPTVPAPPPWALILWLWVPLLAVAALKLYLGASRLHAGDTRPWLHAGLLVAIAVACTFAHARRRIDLRDGRLEIRSTLFTRRVPVPAMRLDAARIVDLAEHTELKPGLRKRGFGYPGFSSGIYRTRGGQLAFCLLTRSERVLAIPLRDGSWLLLSPERPRELLQDLRAYRAP
ncbi:MAG: PH domain-containing protein [Pseudomonas sp.]